MKLSHESKLALAKLLIIHGYNRFEGTKLKCNKPEIDDCDNCKVKKTCNSVKAEFLEHPYYINNYPELFV